MPYINIKIVKGSTPEEKEKLIEGLTRVVSETLNKNPQMTYVVIDEVETDHWGVGGESVTKRRQKKEA
jgi:4-oxalocrotonate tautomerase